MANSSSKREEEIRSALERLPIAVVVIENGRTLRPYNRKGIEFFEQEALTWDLLQARPSHPLSRFIRATLEGGPADVIKEAAVQMPSGNAYQIEVSRRSEKGAARLLMLLVQPRSRDAAPPSLERWNFSSRELDVVQQLLGGASTPESCERMGISAETLKSHISRILEKTSCRNRAELVAKLLREP